jgi:hypothetical protein
LHNVDIFVDVAIEESRLDVGLLQVLVPSRHQGEQDAQGLVWAHWSPDVAVMNAWLLGNPFSPALYLGGALLSPREAAYVDPLPLACNCSADKTRH